MVDDVCGAAGRSDGYSPPPPTVPPSSYPQPGSYSQPGSYTQPGSYSQPGAWEYGPAPAPHPGHPQYQYYGPPPNPYLPPGYVLAPQQDPRDRRPGTLTAATVLGYVNAGLMILCGIGLFTGASLANDVSRSLGVGDSPLGAELTVDALLDFLAAGLLIGGSVAIASRSAAGRAVYSVGGGLVAAMSLYWLLRFDGMRRDGFVFYALLFAAIAVVGLSLAWVPAATTWFATRRPGRDTPLTTA